VDPVVWALRHTPAAGTHIDKALELLQGCAARANHDYFHHYTSTPKPFADALIAACDPLEKGFHGYSGYEVCSIMMHQLLLKAADAQHGGKLSAQSLAEAKDFYSTLAKLANALDPKIARQLCPYLSTIYLHFHQLSWGKINLSTASGTELVRAMNGVNVQGRWDTAESVHLLDQMRTQVLFSLINGLTTDTMGTLRLPATFTIHNNNRPEATFAEGSIASVSAHFSDVETAWNHTEHAEHFRHACQVISSHYREQFSMLEWMAAPAGTLYHNTLRR
jgi:hypothetical protein